MRNRILLLALVLVACSVLGFAQSKGTVSVMFQGGEPEQAAVQASLKRFEAATGIKVVSLYTPHDAFNEKLSGYINSGDMPDIFQVDGPFLSNYVWSGNVAPIQQYLDKAVVADMTASNRAQCTYPIDGKLYAISHQDSTVVLYANKKYLNKIKARIPKGVADAWTMAEFEDVMSKLAALPEVKWPLDIMNAYGPRGEWGTYGFGPMFYSAGTGIIDSKSWKASGVLDSAKNLAFAQKLQTWSKKGWFVPKSAGDNQFFAPEHAAAMAWCGHWLWPASHDSLGDDLVVLPLPNFGNGTKSPNASWVWTIAAKAKNKENAGKLLSFIMTDMAFFKDCNDMNVFPALGKFASIATIYKDPKGMAVAMEQAAKTAVSRPAHPAYPTITKSFAEAFDDIVNGGVDPAVALKKAAVAIDADIADNGGYPPFGKK
jgi:multiple sugar transport system substrate-binding protein